MGRYLFFRNHYLFLGTLKFPPEYPFKPPAVTMVTPSGIISYRLFILISQDASKQILVSVSPFPISIPKNGIHHGKSPQS